MADNVVANSVPVATRSVTYSGDASQNAQVVGLVAFSGADDAKVAADLPGDATNGLLVNLGANNDVTITGSATVSGTVTANAGTNLNTSALALEAGGNLAGVRTAVELLDDAVVVDNAAFTDATTKVGMAGFIFDDVAGTALTENDAAAARIDSKRAQVLVLEDATTRGQRAAVTASNALKVDGSEVTQPVSGTVSATVSGTVTANAGTNLNTSSLALETGGNLAGVRTAVELLDDAVVADNTGFTDGTTKLDLAGFIFDEVAGTALTEDDAAAARVDSKRAQVLVLEDATTRGRRATVSAGGALSVDGSGVTQPVSGTVTVGGTVSVLGATADGTSAAGNPVTAAAVARTANRTSVTDGQTVRVAADKQGRLITVAGNARELIGQQHTQISNSTTETTIVTAAASTFHDLTELVITNATATAVACTLRDATAGTVRAIFALAASGGIVIPFPRPMTQTTANNNWTLTLSVNTVTVNILAQFERNV